MMVIFYILGLLLIRGLFGLILVATTMNFLNYLLRTEDEYSKVAICATDIAGKTCCRR